MSLNLLRAICIACLSVHILGCSFLQPANVPQIKQYTLKHASTKRATSKPIDATLVISMPQAAAGYDTKQMIYTTDGLLLQSFSEHQWVASPSYMLFYLIQESVDNLGHFRAVVTAPFGGRSQLRLDTTLLAFQQEVYPSKSRFKITMEMRLVDTIHQKVIVTKRVTTSAPSNDDPYSGVNAANKAVNNLLTQIAKFSERYA